MNSVFVITDDKGRYMRRDCTGKYTITRNRSLADEYTARYSAANALKSSIPVKIKRGFYVREEGNSCNKTDAKKPKTAQNTQKPKQKMDKHIDEVTKLSIQPIIEGNLGEISNGIDSLVNLVVDIETRKSELEKDLVTIQGKRQDVMHYMEFNNLGGSQGYHAYKLMQQIMQQRRKIKDELAILNELSGCKMDVVTLKEIQIRVSALEHRKYEPRVLKELFE